MPLPTDQLVRWYICPLVASPEPGHRRVPPAIRNTLQGRWTTYGLPGMNWCIARVRGQKKQLDILPPEIVRWPVKDGALWKDETRIPKTITDVLTLVSFIPDGNKMPDEVLTDFCKWQRLVTGGGDKFSREAEKRPDEVALNAVEEV